MNTAGFSISALGPQISEQATRLGLIATGKPIEIVDRISHGIILGFIHGCITSAEFDRAHLRLLKAAKFKARPAALTTNAKETE